MSGWDITLICVGGVVLYSIITAIVARLSFEPNDHTQSEASRITFGAFWPLWFFGCVVIGPFFCIGWLISLIAIPGKFSKTFGTAARNSRREVKQLKTMHTSSITDLVHQGWQLEHAHEHDCSEHE